MKKILTVLSSTHIKAEVKTQMFYDGLNNPNAVENSQEEAHSMRLSFRKLKRFHCALGQL